MYDTEEFNELADKLAKNLKTQQNVSDMTKMLDKVAMERILELEMEEHLGEKKGGQRPSGNSRNGYTQKTVKTENAEIDLEIPRDRDSSFEPQLIKKNQRRTGDMDSKILTLYAKGMTTRDIADTFKELYDVDVSHTLIFKITEGVMDEVIAWQNRPLDAVYPIVYLDCIVIKVRDAAKLEELLRQLGGGGESVELDPYSVTLNGVNFELSYEMFAWDELPADVEYERQLIRKFTTPDCEVRWFEAVYVSTGNLNWYQAAYLAQDAGGYLASITSEEENSFVFELINDEKYFSFFDENGSHYGIGIGPFLGGYQPEGSVEPAGGWTWLSGEDWDYTNWAQNLDDGVIDKDPRDNTQPNDSADGQAIMGFGELNVPVPTWGDYTDSVGTYGTRGPTKRYGFVIEYETDPAGM